MVWPKLVVSDYPEMLRKLSLAAFCVTLGCVALLRNRIAGVDELFRLLDVTPPIEAFSSVSVPFATFIVALVVAFLSESIKLHDKVSDVLRIRTVFDVRWILVPMALLSGARLGRAQFDRVTAERRRLMGEVFYRYASSSKQADIDGHLITQALTAWSWYWICVESIVIGLPTTLILVSFGDWKPAAIMLALALLALTLMKVFRAEANKYADAEVGEILSDVSRVTAVRSVFDAL